MKIIDVRCRPPFGCFIKNGFFDKSNSPFSVQCFAPRFGCVQAESVNKVSFDLFMQEMKEAGITQAVVPIRLLNEDDNETLAELISQYPDLFIGSAGIDHRGGEQAILQIKKYVTEGPCRAIIMEPGMRNATAPDNETYMFPIYDYCQENNIPVMLSFGGFTGTNIDYNHPRSIEAVAQTFPKLKLALCHGAWPWATQAVHLAFRFENVYLSPDIYALNCAGAADYISAANYMLHDKILYGSAYPMVDMLHSVQHYVKMINEKALPNVMGLNALKFFDLT